MNQRDHFNAVAHVWDQKCKHDPQKIIRILEMIGIGKDQKILDVGTGTGVLIPYLVDRIGSDGFIKAVDVSDQMIEFAKSKYVFSNVEFHCEDAIDYGSFTEEFDHIICFSMFPHFKNQKSAVEKLSNRLKPGGRLTIAHSQSRDAINRLHLKEGEVVKKDRLPEMDIIKSYLVDSNMRVVVEVDHDDLFVVTGELL